MVAVRRTQDPVTIGGGLSSEISYTVNIGSRSFSGVECNSSNHCTLRVNGLQLMNGLLTVSVLAWNAVGSGDTVSLPISGKVKLIHVCMWLKPNLICDLLL